MEDGASGVLLTNRSPPEPLCPFVFLTVILPLENELVTLFNTATFMLVLLQDTKVVWLTFPMVTLEFGPRDPKFKPLIVMVSPSHTVCGLTLNTRGFWADSCLISNIHTVSKTICLITSMFLKIEDIWIMLKILKQK
jgi:hypothetical protein